MKNYNIKKDEITIANVVYCITSPEDYSMSRLLILENMPNMDYGEYMLVEGGHCSCYGFDETDYDATIYSKTELLKVLKENEYGALRGKAYNFMNYYLENKMD